MNSLTAEDLNVLMEALEAWEVKDQIGDLLGGIIEQAVSGRNPLPSEYLKEKAKAEEEGKRQKQWRKERSIMLRAKLLTLRDTMDVEAFINR